MTTFLQSHDDYSCTKIIKVNKGQWIKTGLIIDQPGHNDVNTAVFLQTKNQHFRLKILYT